MLLLHGGGVALRARETRGKLGSDPECAVIVSPRFDPRDPEVGRLRKLGGDEAAGTIHGDVHRLTIIEGSDRRIWEHG